MKKFYVNCLAMMMAIVSVGFASCSKDEESYNPEGMIEINLDNGGQYFWVNQSYSFHIYMNSKNNFRVLGNDAKIVSVGQVAGLGAIKNIPEVGWGEEVAVIPGAGYIVRTDEGKYENNQYVWQKTYKYTRLYVVENRISSTTGGIMGARIKYQADWR